MSGQFLLATNSSPGPRRPTCRTRAADYMANHRYATITSLNWKGDVAPDVDHNPLRTP